MPSVRLSVRLSTCPFITFCINLNISFIYEHIFTKFAGNVYGYKNLSLKNFSLRESQKQCHKADCAKVQKVEVFVLSKCNNFCVKSYCHELGQSIVLVA